MSEEVNQEKNMSEEGDIAITATTSNVSLPSMVYWDSTNAKNLFGAHPEDRNSLVTLEWKIEKLKTSNQMTEGREISFLEMSQMMVVCHIKSTKYVNGVLFFVLHVFMQRSTCNIK